MITGKKFCWGSGKAGSYGKEILGQKSAKMEVLTFQDH